MTREPFNYLIILVSSLEITIYILAFFSMNLSLYIPIALNV